MKRALKITLAILAVLSIYPVGYGIHRIVKSVTVEEPFAKREDDTYGANDFYLLTGIRPDWITDIYYQHEDNRTGFEGYSYYKAHLKKGMATVDAFLSSLPRPEEELGLHLFDEAYDALSTPMEERTYSAKGIEGQNNAAKTVYFSIKSPKTILIRSKYCMVASQENGFVAVASYNEIVLY